MLNRLGTAVAIRSLVCCNVSRAPTKIVFSSQRSGNDVLFIVLTFLDEFVRYVSKDLDPIRPKTTVRTTGGAESISSSTIQRLEQFSLVYCVFVIAPNNTCALEQSI
jgi:hypothetical protein